MIVYHGSNSRFNTLKISKSLVRFDSTLTNEGLGIYITLDKAVAYSYGKYLYTLEIDDKYIKDFRLREVCERYIKGIRDEIMNKFNLDIFKYIDVGGLVRYMNFGGVAIYNTCGEIKELLDSNEAWYILREEKRNRVYKYLKTYDKKHLNVYLFKYNIKNIGIIKNVSPEVVRIVTRELV